MNNTRLNSSRFVNKNSRIVIIGAGPCGLGAGWRLNELGYTNFHIYEQSNHAGGLATSITDEMGFIWDLGGHVLHSHYQYFDEMFEKVMQKNYYEHERSAWIWLFDQFIPYPLQKNIHYLPKKIQKECIEALLRNSKIKYGKPKHFADWIIQTFGEGISKYFLYPYNQKVWAYPPEKMSYDWVGDRVAPLTVDELKKNKTNTSWGPNRTFKYPYKGTGDIWKRVAGYFPQHISFSKKLVRIDAKKKKVWFSDGSNSEYDLLMSTVPLDLFIQSINDVNVPFTKGSLFASAVTLVGIGIQGKVPSNLTEKNWMYFPQEDVPFFRVTVLSNYSPQLAPKNSWSLLTEVSLSQYTKEWKPYIEEAVIQGLRKTKLITANNKIISIWVYPVRYGYPTPTLKRDLYVHKTFKELEKYDIFPRGRFGAWKYEVSNQDHTFMQGVEWVDAQFLNQPELTLFNPNTANKYH